jgi:surface antigen
VFQPYTYQADGYGHVAYVRRVYGTWFQVSEMNFPFLGYVTYRWIRNDGGISFID